jgi:hypothetical protein
MKSIIFAILWLFIGLVSTYDGYLNLRYPVTVATEENPIARWILRISGNDAPLLISCKFFGTSLCLTFLVLCYFRNKERAWMVTSALAAVQGAVLMYLTEGFMLLR